jgi:hypothetical protein
VLKLTAGDGFAIEAIRVLGVAGDAWPRVMRAVQAVAIMEVGLGLAMLVLPAPRKWIVLLACALAMFLCWDVARFLSGGLADCGCFGPIKIATAWWHVWVKHAVLLGSCVVLAANCAWPQRKEGNSVRSVCRRSDEALVTD